MTTYEQILKKIEDIPSEDETMDMLQKAMEHYCSNYDICEGYKYALKMTLNDQYQNHAGEQESNDLDILSDILDGVL
jgi:hypothetical protein